MIRHWGYVLGFYWFPVIGWAALIFSLSSVTGEKLPEWEIPYLDKCIHAVEFGILAVFFYRALEISSPRLLPLQLVFVTLLACGLFAVSDEWHQTFVPGRHSNPYDLLADLLGMSVFLIFRNLFQKSFKSI